MVSNNDNPAANKRDHDRRENAERNLEKFQIMMTLLILPALATVCYGRIGETLEQCKRRNGEVKSQIDFSTDYMRGSYQFSIKGIVATAHFDSGGKCDVIYYEAEKGDITDKNIETFWAANKGSGIGVSGKEVINLKAVPPENANAIQIAKVLYSVMSDDPATINLFWNGERQLSALLKKRGDGNRRFEFGTQGIR